jgi:hypothetical protein
MANLYSNPHDEVNVFDGTSVVLTKTTNNGPILFQPIASMQGIDTGVLDYDNYEDFVSEHGIPNIDVTGQAMHHAALWLQNGGRLKTVRLTATDAVRANLLLTLNIKIVEQQDTDTSGNPLYIDAVTGAVTILSTGNAPKMVKRANVKWSKSGLERASVDKTDMQSVMMAKYAEDTEGFHFPLICYVAKGKGSYGKMFRTRLTMNPNRDADTDYRNYFLQIMKNQNGVSNVDNSPTTVSFYPSAIYNSKTYFAPDVVDRYQNYPVKLFMVNAYWAQITSLLLPVLQQSDPTITAEKIDFMLFHDTDLRRYDYVDVDTDSLDLTALEGYALMNGSDGAFDLGNTRRNQAINDRLLDLFNGTITSEINDGKEHPFQIALDACYTLEVKKAMVAWWAKRKKNFQLVLDGGNELNTKADVINFLTEDMRPDEYGILINIQTFDTSDPFSGKIIRVSMNYLYALLYARHVLNKETGGYSKPFAGIDIPLDDYIIPKSLKPYLSEDEDKSDIYKLRGNYIEKTNGFYVFGSNVTSQIKESECSYFNNISIFLVMRSSFLELGAYMRWKKMSTDDDIRTLQKMANTKMGTFVGKDIKAGDISILKDSTDPRGKTVRTKVRIGFDQYLLDNVFDFDIERL